MAKLTEKEVVEQINSEDISLLDNYAPHIADKESLVKFEKDKEVAEKRRREKEDELDKFFEGIGVEDRVTGSHDEGYGRDRDTYYDVVLCIGGCTIDKKLDSWSSHFSIDEKVEALNEFLKEYNEKQNRFNHLVAGKELEEYNNLIDELNEIKNKGFFGKLAASGRVRQINKRLAELKKYADEYNELNFDLKVKKNAYDKVSGIENEMNEKFEELKKLEELEKSFRYGYNYWDRGERYKEKDETEERIKNREKNVKNFKLVKFYREHEAEFANTRKTLLMIYAENTNQEFQENFKDMLKAYDQAAKIAKEEGKDFATLKEVEQFEYFEAAQKVIEANKKFDAHKQGGGKE